MGQVVHSVNIMIAILLVAVGIVIYYIFKYDEFWPNGSDDTTKQEELLQFSSNGDQQSIGWRYDRRDHRSGFRPLQKGTSQDSWSGYSGEED